MSQGRDLYLRYQDAKKYKDRWLSQYSNLYDYVLLNRDAYNVKYKYNDDGRNLSNKVWDFTAPYAADLHANNTQSLLIPEGRDWGNLVADSMLFSEEEIQAYKPVIDEVNKNIRYRISKSNLSMVSYGSLLDLVGGTGVIFIESPSDEQPIKFRSIPSLTTYIQESSDDVINSCWFDIGIKGYDLLLSYPKLDEVVKAKIRENPQDVYTMSFGQVKQDNGMYYFYAFIEQIDPFRPLLEKEFDYEKIIPFRSKVRPGESEGRGIALDLMPLIIDLNNLVEADRKGKDLKADPMLTYDPMRVNPYQLRQLRGAMIPRAPGEPFPIEAIPMPSNPDVFQHEQSLRQQLIQAFQIDPLGEADSPVKSATEISIRENRAQRYSATNMARIINELPRKIYESVAKILASRNMLTRDGSIAKINLKKFNFEFQSPLFDIQKKENINNLINYSQFIQQFFGEGALMAISNIGEINNFLIENNNLQSKLSKSKEDIDKLIQAMGKMQQQAALPSPTTTAGDVQFPQSTPQLQ